MAVLTIAPWCHSCPLGERWSAFLQQGVAWTTATMVRDGQQNSHLLSLMPVNGAAVDLALRCRSCAFRGRNCARFSLTLEMAILHRGAFATSG